MPVPPGVDGHPELGPYVGTLPPFTDPYRDIAATGSGSVPCREPPAVTVAVAYRGADESDRADAEPGA
ncbi:hypothetical protein ACIQU6_21560 [Streptomyces sp. NPDC090442]|uniref:hypothetical protein n=1 Tax=Streptomyces sp. NPDC090442 TaxID=3365962 RepID=UPI003806A6D5